LQQRTKQTTRCEGPAHRAAWLRFVLALGASLVAAGYLAAVLHMAFFAHARCAEHGELVHVDGDAHASAPAPGHHGATDATSAPSAGEGGEDPSDEHDHCLLGTAQSEQARIPEAGHRVLSLAPPPAVAPARAPRPPRVLVPPPPIALLFLSPKSSPPALA
jgi:hypothetical protein